LVWDVLVVIEFEDLVGDVVEEVLVMCDCDDGVFVVGEEVFELED